MIHLIFIFIHVHLYIHQESAGRPVTVTAILLLLEAPVLLVLSELKSSYSHFMLLPLLFLGPLTP